MDEHQPPDDFADLGEPATPEALRAIVERHHRTRTRTLGIALALALIAGPLAGWAIGHAGGGGTQVSTASQPNASDAANRPTPAGAAASAQAFGVGADAPKAQKLFTRTSSDGIAIRAYRMEPPAPPAETSSSTAPTTSPSGKTQDALCRKLDAANAQQSVVAHANSGAVASACGANCLINWADSVSSGDSATTFLSWATAASVRPIVR